jgi:hypothetical protein
VFARYPWTLGLVIWSFLVWTTRINNIVADDDLSGGDMAARLALSISFTVLAVLTVSALRRESEWLRPLVAGFVAWTVLVWIVRGVQIALGDHDAPFIAVHVVLAVVSIALAVQAIREQLRSTNAVATGS